MAVSPFCLAFEGPQTIAMVEEALGRLRRAMASGEAFDIDLTAVAEADLAFVQLLIATRRSVAATGRGLRWRGAANPAVAEVLVRGGLAGASLLEDLTATGDSP